MADQLLWIETLFKGTLGLILVIMPLAAAKAAGLPHGNSAFWPRLLGTALLGMAAAFAMEGFQQITARGLGLGGAVLINLVTFLSLLGTLIFNSVSSKRGKGLIWLLIAAVLALMLFEIAHA